MLERDRQLLAQVATVNRNLGLVVCEVMSRQDGGVLRAADVRTLGEYLCGLGCDLLTRAEEIDGTQGGAAR
ncbi:hypothetical protein [Amycolatopsis aidingensis]|uniref:hypothetical protein n=1 Tax=Amycolatopsis aidingensis TaxID=2842453 RepID=UPI001C0B6CC3|nr:hypothetical protein [Amycolatopsis aidingensis]